VLRAPPTDSARWRLQACWPRTATPKPRVNPLAAKAPHFPAKAKSVIFLFMVGAPSSMDTFDPKPKLLKKRRPADARKHGQVGASSPTARSRSSAAPWEFKPYGQSGMPISTLFPHVAKHVDDICFVRNFFTRSVVHAPAMYEVHSGRLFATLPEHGRLGDLRAGQRVGQSAGLRGDAAAGGHARRRHALLGRRLPAGGLSRHAAAPGADADSAPGAARME
jgi:hypothetical protein